MTEKVWFGHCSAVHSAQATAHFCLLVGRVGYLYYYYVDT